MYENNQEVTNAVTQNNEPAYHRENEREQRSYNWDSTQETQPPKKEKTSSGFLRKVMIAACCGLCFGLFAGLGLYAVNEVVNFTKESQKVYETSGSGLVDDVNTDNVGKNNPSVIKEESNKSGINNQVTVVTSDYSDMVEKVMPAMVSIVNTYEEKYSYWGQIITQDAQSGGSGIIIGESDTELLIATNNHVVDEAVTLEVTFIDGSVAEAQLKGKDARMDLAVIAIPLDRLEDSTKKAITIAKMGDSDALKLGEPVVAIGNALGYGQSVTGGYISALNREVEKEDGTTGTFIQTDAAINHGNSGGALLNVNGEVIGINSNKISGTSIEGMGYAIPISAAEPIIGDLMLKETKHKVEHVGYIGIQEPMTVPDDLIRYYNFPEGVFIRGVAKGSPAEAAGILSNDILVNFDGEIIRTYEDLQGELEYYGPGTEVTITVMRQTQGQYEEVDIKLTLGKRPDAE